VCLPFRSAESLSCTFQQFLQKPAGFLVLTLVAGVLLMLPDWLKKK